MQLHLNTDELNLLADTLLERVGAISAQRLPPARVQGTADKEKGEGQYDDLLDKVLMRDLRLDADELEQVTDLLGERERALKEEMLTAQPRVPRQAETEAGSLWNMSWNGSMKHAPCFDGDTAPTGARNKRL